MVTNRDCKKVYQDETPINALVHGLSFATDAEVNSALKLHYKLYSYLSTNNDVNKALLQGTIHEWKDYVEELYATTQYEYNPIENYDRYEEGGWTDATAIGARTKTSQNGSRTETDNIGARHSTGSESASETPGVTVTEEKDAYGYNSSTGSDEAKITTTPTGSNTSSGSSSASSDAATDTHTAAAYTDTVSDAAANDSTVHTFNDYHVHGNIGVKTAMEMIEEQRNIIVDVLEFYIKKFADCFNVDFMIAFDDFDDM